MINWIVRDLAVILYFIGQSLVILRLSSLNLKWPKILLLSKCYLKNVNKIPFYFKVNKQLIRCASFRNIIDWKQIFFLPLSQSKIPQWYEKKISHSIPFTNILYYFIVGINMIKNDTLYLFYFSIFPVLLFQLL